VAGLNVSFCTSSLPYVLVNKNGHANTFESTPLPVFLQQVPCHIQKGRDGMIAAHTAFIKIPDACTSWVLPLFTFAYNEALNRPKSVTLLHGIIYPQKTVELLREHNPIKNIDAMLTLYRAAQYLQTQTNH